METIKILKTYNNKLIIRKYGARFILRIPKEIQNEFEVGQILVVSKITQHKKQKWNPEIGEAYTQY